jgi:Zn finger protein HypA/HybF involved in hydrogenase expression
LKELPANHIGKGGIKVYDLNERVSYLQGLIDGLNIADDTKEGKAISVAADILEEIAYVISDLIEAQKQLEEYIDCIDDDLADLEDEVYVGDLVEIECPKCGEPVEIDASALEEADVTIICPECSEMFTPEDVDWITCYCELDDDEWDDDDEDEDDDDEEDDED